MFEYKEFELLAQLYVERQDDTPETKAIMDRVREQRGLPPEAAASAAWTWTI